MDEMTDLFVNKDGNKLVSNHLIPFEEMNQKVWTLNAEIFVPAAASRLVSKEQISQMISSGLEVISPGANVPFADKEIFFGPIMEFTDSQVSLLPDFISNCGIARVFAYLMEARQSLPMQDAAIFNDTSETIKKALLSTYNKNNSKKEICKTAFEIALKQLI
jgi:glutamate dehydrogenase/leucine dehydrogenase